MLDLRAGVLHLDIRHCMRPALVAQQQAVALREVAHVFRRRRNPHQAAIGIVGFARTDPLGDDRGTAVLAQMDHRSEEHTSELQSLMRISYAVFCLKKKNTNTKNFNWN